MSVADSHPLRRLLVVLMEHDPKQRNSRKLADDANKFGRDIVGFKKLNKALLNNWVRPKDNSTPQDWRQLAALLKTFDVDENLADIMFRVTTRGWDLETLQQQASPALACLLTFRQPTLSFRQPTFKNPNQNKPFEVVATGESSTPSVSAELIYFDSSVEPFQPPAVNAIVEYIQVDFQTRQALINKPATSKWNKRIRPTLAAAVAVMLAFTTAAWLQTRPDREQNTTPATSNNTVLTKDWPDLSGLIAQADTNSGPWLAAAHEDYRFRISGVVPDEETRVAIGEAVDIFYARFNTQDITVDPNVGTAPWTDAPAKGVIPMLQALAFHLHQGGFSLNGDQLKVEGQAPNLFTTDGAAFIDMLKTTASKYPALPTYEEDIEVVELDKFPELEASYDGESMVLSGTLPSQELADAIMADVEVLFDGFDVVYELAIDDDMFAAFPVRNFQRPIKAFTFSREFNLRLQEGEVTVTAISGIEFDEGSADLPVQVQSALRSLIAFMRLVNFPVELTGHTDTQESSEPSQLSLERANAVREYLVGTGELDPERAEKVSTFGKGSQTPIASNNTREGRRQNRRVEVRVVEGKPL